MKCPKCGYLGFEDVERCRNCGYEFSLLPSPVSAELPLRTRDEDLAPLDDLTLVDAAARPQTGRTGVPSTFDPPSNPTANGLASAELPLFSSSVDERRPSEHDDAPLITRASPPRAPLAVRRATPEVPRIRSSQLRTPMLDLNAFDAEPAAPGPASRARPPVPSTAAVEYFAPEPAGWFARVVAAVVDVAILLGIDVAVVYFTMQICGVTWQEIHIIPKIPLGAFLAAQNLGYFIGLTIGGQTLGKMLTGIRVVSAEDEEMVDVGRSILRTLVWCLLAIPAGLGFLTAVFGPEGRGLHDRFAGTKVVRAGN